MNNFETTRDPASTSPRVIRFDRFDVALILFVLLSYAIVHFMPFAPKKFGDDVFHVEAKAIAQAIHARNNWSELFITRAPGPVLYYAIPYSFLPADSSEDSYWLARLFWTVALMCLSVLLIRRAAAYSGDQLSGKVAAGIVLLTPFSVYYSYGIYAEPLAYLGVSLAAFGWAKWRFLSSDSQSLRVDRSVILLCLGAASPDPGKAQFDSSSRHWDSCRDRYV
jgi:hypothetical protein